MLESFADLSQNIATVNTPPQQSCIQQTRYVIYLTSLAYMYLISHTAVAVGCVIYKPKCLLRMMFDFV